MSRRPRVVVIAEGAIPTGFARVATSVFARLVDAFEVRQLTPHALPSDRPPDDPPWPIAALPRADGPRGEAGIAAAVAALRPDLVWMLADLQIVREYARLLRGVRATGARLVAYCPVDLTPLPPELVAPLRELDALVAYTAYGLRALNAALDAGAPASPRPRMETIPHGVDTTVFAPLERERAREELLGPGHENDFIVLNANRNQPRKRIDTTIRAFARFAHGKPPGVRLHLHMGMRDRGWDLAELVRRHGLVERTIFTTDLPTMPFVPDALMNLVYNAADVGVNTATTEGWGLVAMEHAATGAAQVMPAHSVFREVWEGAALLVPPRVGLVTPDGMFDEHYVSERDVARALGRLYGDPALRARMAAAAQANATRPGYSWSVVARHWHDLFRALLTGTR